VALRTTPQTQSVAVVKPEELDAFEGAGVVFVVFV
jgi:hypothetical protein